MDDKNQINKFDIMSLVTSMIRDEFIAVIHNFGDFILMKFPDGKLFKLFIEEVEKE